MPDAVSAFIGGSVPAVALWVPFDLRVNEAGKGAKEIDNAGNYPDAGVGDGWIANNEWYADNQDDRQEDHRRVARRSTRPSATTPRARWRRCTSSPTRTTRS